MSCMFPAAWVAALEKVGLEFGDVDELMSKMDELIEAAPEADDDDEDDSEEDSD